MIISYILVTQKGLTRREGGREGGGREYRKEKLDISHPHGSKGGWCLLLTDYLQEVALTGRAGKAAGSFPCNSANLACSLERKTND